MQTTCAQCQNFISGDKVQRFDRSGSRYGTYEGIGECKAFNAFLAKKPSTADIEQANKSMGNQLLRPHIERHCTRFLSSK